MYAEYDLNIKTCYCFPYKFVEKDDIMVFCKMESRTIKTLKYQWPSIEVVHRIYHQENERSEMLKLTSYIYDKQPKLVNTG